MVVVAVLVGNTAVAVFTGVRVKVSVYVNVGVYVAVPVGTAEVIVRVCDGVCVSEGGAGSVAVCVAVDDGIPAVSVALGATWVIVPVNVIVGFNTVSVIVGVAVSVIICVAVNVIVAVKD
jgi:hypothetical protein